MGQGSVAVEHLQLVVDFEVAFAAEGAEHFHCLVTARGQQLLIVSRPFQVVDDTLVGDC